MKKIISLLLALALALSITLTAAEETAAAPVEPLSVNWTDVAPEIVGMGLTGDFYTLQGMDVAFWVPAALQPADIDATYEETNVLAAFNSTSGKEMYVAFYELPVDDIAYFAEVADQVGAQAGQLLIINGLSAYSFVFENALHVSFLVEGGYVLSFDFYPASDFVFNAIARIIASSVQPYADEE
ncbi:MAG: hypothetical protein IKN04_17635 [Clostridia bacterium]|nr:hypothetical protein [Clostridia bacterium]